MERQQTRAGWEPAGNTREGSLRQQTRGKAAADTRAGSH